MNDTNDDWQNKANYFFKNKRFLHIELKNKRFFNGEIIEVNSDFIIFYDRMIGEMPIFFSEIYSMEIYTARLK